MSQQNSTLFRWIEAHEAQHMSEQAMLARRDSEWDAPAREVKTPGERASRQAERKQGDRLRLGQIRDALLRWTGRAAERRGFFRPAAKGGVLLVGLLAGVGTLGIGAAPGKAQMAASLASPMQSADAGNGETAGLASEAAAARDIAELARLWQSAREQALPGRLPEEAQQQVWRRLWQMDPSFRESDGLDEIGAATEADVAAGGPVKAAGTLAARRDTEAQ